MSDFTIKGPEGNKFDPAKRVRYTTGQVLGADDFMQEQVFFLERDNLHQRGLHGYGVVCGLDVSIEDGEVTVGPGMAIDHLGRSIRVDASQCGDLKEWLEQHQDHQIEPVSVTLCYAECASDSLPLPGAPCRGDEESVAASRITTGFEINFSATAPQQDYEDTVRLFGEMLGEVRGDDNVAAIDIAAAVADFKAKFKALPSDKATSGERLKARRTEEKAPLLVKAGQPPWGRVPWNQLDELMTALLDLWVRELKPALPLATKNCGSEGEGKGCILLATLTNEQGVWSPNFDARPLLLSTRMLQEYQRRRDTQQLDHGRLEGLDGDDHQQYLPRSGERPMLDDLIFEQKKGVPAFQVQGLRESAADGEALVHGQSAGGDLDKDYPNPQVSGILSREIKTPTKWVPGSLLVLTKSSNRYHWAIRALKPEEIPAPNLLLDDLQDCDTAAAQAGQILQHTNGKWIPGDLVLGLSDLTDCDVASAGDGQHLAFSKKLNHWIPVDPPVGNGEGPQLPTCTKTHRGDVLTCTGKDWQAEPLRVVELADIQFIRESGEVLIFEFWLHPSIPDNSAEVPALSPDMFQVSFEANHPINGQDFLAPVDVVQTPENLARNVFQVTVMDPSGKYDLEPHYCRVLFNAKKLPVVANSKEMSLRDFAHLRGLNYEGQSPDRDFITQFVRVGRSKELR